MEIEEKIEKPAGYWIRTLATLIDCVAIGFLNMVLSFALFGKFSSGLSLNMDFSSYLTEAGRSFILNFLIGMSYETILIGYNGQTLGKLLTRIKVINLDGTQISYKRAFGRYWAKILSGLTFGIGFLLVVFRKDKRSLHDLIVKTKVSKIVKNWTVHLVGDSPHEKYANG